MSEIPTDPPSKTAASGPAAERPKKARRWRRRLAWVSGIVLALIGLTRLSMPVLFPAVLRHVCAGYKLNVSYERSEFNLLSGDVGLWYLRLTPFGSNEPLMTADYVRGDISPLKLFLGKLDAWRVEADGVSMNIVRDRQGHIAALDTLMAGASQAAPQVSATTASSKPWTVDLMAPLKLDALRLTNISATIKDESVEPAFSTQVAMNLRLSNVGSRSRPTSFEMDVWAQSTLDSLRIAGTANCTPQRIDGTADVLLGGLRLRNVASYLQLLGITPTAHVWDMRGHAAFSAVAANPATSLAITARLSNIQANADGQAIFAVRDASVDAPQVTPSSAKVSLIELKGVSAKAGRNAAGELEMGGLVFGPTPASAVSSPPPPAATQPSSVQPFEAVIDRVHVQDVVGQFADAAVTPGVQLALNLDDLDLRHLSTQAADVQPTTISARLHAPNLIGAIRADGTASVALAHPSVNLAVAIDGIRPDAIKPYLERAGMRSELQDGHLSLSLSAQAKPTDQGVIASAAIEGVKFSDGDQTLLEMPRIAVQDAQLDTRGNCVRVGAVLLSGPTVNMRHDRTGLTALGIHLGEAAAATTPVEQSAPAGGAGATPALSLPGIVIDRFAWTGIHVAVRDEAAGTTLGVQNAEFHGRYLDFDFTGNDRQPGDFQGWLTAPGLIGRMDLSGHLYPAGRQVKGDATVLIDGITLSAARPYLNAMGLNPTLHDGSLTTSLTATIGPLAQGLGGSLDVSDTRLTDQGETVCACSDLAVDGFSIGSRIDAGAIRVRNAYADVARDQAGRLDAAGLMLIGVPPAAKPAVPPTPPPPADPLNLLIPAINVALESLHVESATISWEDRFIQPRVKADVTIDASVGKIDPVHPMQPIAFGATVRVPGTIERAEVGGSAALSSASRRLTAALNAGGLQASPLLAAYLPSNIRCELNGGRLQAHLEAALTDEAAGQYAAALRITGVRYQNGNAPQPLFALDSLTFSAPRIDLPGHLVDVEQASDHGLQISVHRSSDGALHALGFAMGGPAPVVDPPPTAPPAPPAASPAPRSAGVLPPRRILPQLNLKWLDLNLDKLEYSDDLLGDGKPLTLRAHLGNLTPIQLAGPHPGQSPPCQLQLNASLTPIVRDVSLAMTVVPFADEPALTADLRVSGISGKGAASYLPASAMHITGDAMQDGNFQSHLEATAHLSRRGPYDFDLGHGIGLDLLVKDTAYRDETHGQPLLGLQGLEADGVRIDPNARLITIPSLELTTPIIRGYRDARGIHVLGFVIQPGPPASTRPQRTTVVTIAPEHPATRSTAAPPKMVAQGGTEIRLDRFLITGLDMRIEDRTSNPPLIVPLNSLDLEARNLTNRFTPHSRPIEFSAILGAGQVPLPTRRGDALDVARLENRDLFSQITLAGSLAMTPSPHGWAKLTVSGFELLGLRGPMETAGEHVGGGAYDGDVELHLLSDGTLRVQSRHVLTDAQLTEGDDGPIRRMLQLPSPLNVVIGLVQDADGSITLPVNFSVQHGQIEGIGPAAAAAAAQVLTTAIASAPLKIVNSLVGKPGRQQTMVSTIDFAPSDTALDAEDAVVIASIAADMNKHTKLAATLRPSLGAEDIARAAILANPSPADAASLAEALHLNKTQLLRLRDQLAGAAQADLATLPLDQAQAAVMRVQAVDRQIASVEEALDNVYDLMRPGADRQATRRTRAAALQIAHQRLHEVADALTAAGVQDAAQRISLANPEFPTNPPPGAGQVTVTLIQRK